MADLGWMTLAVPEEAGGIGMSAVAVASLDSAVTDVTVSIAAERTTLNGTALSAMIYENSINPIIHSRRKEHDYI